jgi:hypothetical protein
MAYLITRDDPVGVRWRHPPGQESANQMQAAGNGVDLAYPELADPMLNGHRVVALDHFCFHYREGHPFPCSSSVSPLACAAY